jgi:hypothetical protein
MAAQGHNVGFFVLDDFVCEAIHASSIRSANPGSEGKNPGMTVVEEFVFECGSKANLETAVEPLATYITSSNNPFSTFAQAMQILLAKWNPTDQTTAEMIEKLRRVCLPSESQQIHPRKSPPNAATDHGAT